MPARHPFVQPRIEPADPAHAAVLAAIHKASFPPPERWDAGVFAAELALPGVRGLFAPEGGLVLWRVAVDEAEILTLAVVPARRRKGLGAALMRAALRDMAAAGVVALFLEVARGNAAARRLYAALGFARVGLRRHYYASGEDALVLRCNPGMAAPPASGS